MNAITRLAALVICFFGQVESLSAQVLYTVTDLGLPVNATFPFGSATAAGVNNSGQVTGIASTTFPGAPPDRAYRYTAGIGMVDLGSLGPNGSSVGAAINSSGQVAGYADFSIRRAFRFTDGVGMIDLGVLPGQTSSIAEGINDLGHVAGTSGGHLFRFIDGIGMQDLGVPSGMQTALARGINNAGQISVFGISQGSLVRAFRYQDGSGFVDLGTLGGSNANARGINATGSVAGESQTTAGATHAFLFSDSTGMLDLGVLPTGSTSSAFAVNSANVVVGLANSAAGSQRAFVYRTGFGMVDLNDLIGSGTDWVLNGAQGINDAGQIVGFGLHSGLRRAYLLTPVPEPCALSMASVAALGAFVKWRLAKMLQRSLSWSFCVQGNCGFFSRSSVTEVLTETECNDCILCRHIGNRPVGAR